ncbi:hypothetical protein HSBAA_00930 [Vreelandella sulfidaeris]|uniref:Glyceraldehyde 3-phosphate dehydrogenase catalytic domain-containing protein n=1 Tax=Vreelandella sulfidaeris TaxID=115553 RepID=A0A455TZY9_9GAMM|nr:hypothetical protein HSBAA_00930 [Halomonas sulfidaeris]
MDLALTVSRNTHRDDVNAILLAASQQRLKGVLGYTEAPMASVDFNHDPRSGILDATQTRVAGQRLIKLLCWFDNEWGSLIVCSISVNDWLGFRQTHNLFT